MSSLLRSRTGTDNAVKQIRARVTFLSAEEGGRTQPARDNDMYRPDLVVGPPGQRKALVDERGLSTEQYLGIAFTGSGSQMTPGRAYEAQLTLVYHPRVDYSALTPGATFTIREGRRIVGFGSVVESRTQ